METGASRDGHAFAQPERVDALVELSRELGRPERDYVVLGEGNTSALMGDGTFLCTATGARLETVGPSDITRLHLAPLLSRALDDGPCDIPSVMAEARHEESPGTLPPSIETFVHAVCLGLADGAFVAHTHPTELVGLLCTTRAEEVFCAGPLFPDEAVICGVAPLWIDYHSPGLELGRALARRLAAYRETHDSAPRVILLANHGIITIGRSALEALAVTEMAVKAARVRATALSTGMMRTLGAESVTELLARADESVRRDRVVRGAT